MQRSIFSRLTHAAPSDEFSPPLLDPFMEGGSASIGRKAAKEAIRRVAPRKFWGRKAAKIRVNRQEQELSLLPILCRPDELGFDVGASCGVYSVQMSDLVRRCIAFEPRSWQAEYLRQFARYANLPIEVEEAAVSNFNGRTVLRIPIDQQGLSTIEAGNELSDADRGRTVSIDTAARTLDSYAGMGKVGFVKIDVEGHEGAVLEGAKDLLRKSRPRILVEVENRHRSGAVHDVFAMMRAYGYSGFFVCNNRILDISEFDSSFHQDLAQHRSTYVNNFVFVPEEEGTAIFDAAAQLLMSGNKNP